jgi:hypothetical protein
MRHSAMRMRRRTAPVMHARVPLFSLAFLAEQRSARGRASRPQVRTSARFERRSTSALCGRAEHETSVAPMKSQIRPQSRLCKKPCAQPLRLGRRYPCVWRRGDCATAGVHYCHDGVVPRMTLKRSRALLINGGRYAQWWPSPQVVALTAGGDRHGRWWPCCARNARDILRNAWHGSSAALCSGSPVSGEVSWRASQSSMCARSYA